MKRTRRSIRRSAAAVAFGTAPLLLALATPAAAAPHTATLTVGPVSLPSVLPVKGCVDDDCVTTPALTDVTLTVNATTDTSGDPVVLTSVPCPTGAGAAITVTTTVTAKVTIAAQVTGNGPTGPVNIPLGPKTQTITAGTPGLTVSSCTS